MAGSDPWEAILERINDGASLIGLHPDTLRILSLPEKVLEVAVPIRRDSGAIEVFRGWRVHHSSARGPGKGRHPLPPVGERPRDHGARRRHDPQVRRGRRALRWCQGRRAGRPDDALGRASSSASRAVTRWASRRCSVPDRDIPAPDVNTDANVMAWLMDTISMVSGETLTGIVTGQAARDRWQPRSRGRHLPRRAHHHQGCLRRARHVHDRGAGRDPGPRQGRRPARLHAAFGRHARDSGDRRGGRRLQPGRPGCGVCWRVTSIRTGSVAGFDRADPLEPERIWEIECELAVPAALAGVITAEVAEKMGARLIVEAANGPTLPEADPILERRGIVVIPDILANAGGVTASYFEWAQSRQGFAWEGDLVAERLKRVMSAPPSTRCGVGRNELKVTPRRGAVAVALERVGEAIELRGLFPLGPSCANPAGPR